MLKRLKLLFTYGPELDQVLTQLRKANEEREREQNRHRLDLCFKHRQEPKRSHFSEHNCDYCKLLRKTNE